MENKVAIRFPIRWKLSLALAGLSLGLVGAYVAIAKDAFESDKIAYVFESEQSRIDEIAKNFDRMIETSQFLATSLLSSYDAQTKALSPIGQSLFDSQKSVIALEVRSYTDLTTAPLVAVQKNEGAQTELAATPLEGKPAFGDLILTPVGHHHLLLLSTQKGDGDVPLAVRLLLEVSSPFPESGAAGYILTAGSKPFLSKAEGWPEDALASLVKSASTDEAKTFIGRREGKDYLVSSARSRFGDLHFFALTPKETALGGLKILFQRSLAFVMFSAFLTIILSLLLSRGLTRTLAQLTESARKIGQGDFSRGTTVRSRDEMGVLSGAFETMGQEIERLLIETKDKARMEEELKTASLVQSSLFPRSLTFTKNRVSLSGFYVTSTECGGDWWHYFEKGDELYIVIADATGHGTPAALITAAARATFSLIETMDVTLAQMANAWDTAILACSAEKVFMTALLMRINTRTGEAALVNASHEWPFHYVADAAGKLSDSELIGPIGPVLGESHSATRVEQKFTMRAGDRFVLYTDGLFAVVNADDKPLRERTFKKLMTVDTNSATSVESTSHEIQSLVSEHRGATALPDDVTLVVVGMAA